MPPEPNGHQTGDILKDGEDSYWVVLTPWCDLVERVGNPPNAEHVLLARAELLTTFPQYADWIADAEPSKKKKDRFIRLLSAPDSALPGKHSWE